MSESNTLVHWQSGVHAASRAERIKLLYALSHSTMAANFAAAVLAAAWLRDAGGRELLLGWLGAMAAYLALGLGLGLRFRAAATRPHHAPRWEHYFALNTAFGGLVWGALVWLLLPASGDFGRMLAVVILCTVSLAAVALLAPSRVAFYGFMAPIVTAAFPLLLGTFDRPAPVGWTVLIYIALLASAHDLLYRNLGAAFTKRFESEAVAMEQNVIFDSAAEAIGLMRPNYLAKCNRQWGDLFGCSMEEAIGKPAWSWFPSYEDWTRLASACQAAISQGKVHQSAVQLRRSNGELFWAEITGMAVDPANLELGVVWLGIDISDRLRTQADLRASEQRFRDLVSLSTDWYWEQDRQFRFTRISGTVLDRIGVDTEADIGKTRWEVDGIEELTAEQWRSHRELLDAHLPFRDFVYASRMPNGERRWFSISGNPTYDENGDFAGYNGVGTEITERVRAAEQFRHLAHHDTLTGLPNRRLLADRLEQALALARRTERQVALLVFDLDDFKIINDSLGHSAGDSVLCALAQRLRGTVRETDTVARLGGDEFVILVPELANTADAIRVAEKVIEAVGEPIEVGDRQYVLGVSIGISVFPGHAADGEGLLQQADTAMYEAKRVGGSGYRFAYVATAQGGDASAHPPAASPRSDEGTRH